MATLVPIIGLFWIDYEIPDFEPITWITLIIGSAFGLAITIIVSSKSQMVLNLLEKSEREKKNFAKLTLKNNYNQLRKIVESYFETVSSSTATIKDRRLALKAIMPALNTFMNICETCLPNIGDLITTTELKQVNRRFVILHKLLMILEYGSDEQFNSSIQNLDNYTKETNEVLEKI